MTEGGAKTGAVPQSDPLLADLSPSGPACRCLTENTSSGWSGLWRMLGRPQDRVERHRADGRCVRSSGAQERSTGLLRPSSEGLSPGPRSKAASAGGERVPRRHAAGEPTPAVADLQPLSPRAYSELADFQTFVPRRILRTEVRERGGYRPEPHGCVDTVTAPSGAGIGARPRARK